MGFIYIYIYAEIIEEKLEPAQENRLLRRVSLEPLALQPQPTPTTSSLSLSQSLAASWNSSTFSALGFHHRSADEKAEAGGEAASHSASSRRRRSTRVVALADVASKEDDHAGTATQRHLWNVKELWNQLKAHEDKQGLPRFSAAPEDLARDEPTVSGTLPPSTSTPIPSPAPALVYPPATQLTTQSITNPQRHPSIESLNESVVLQDDCAGKKKKRKKKKTKIKPGAEPEAPEQTKKVQPAALVAAIISSHTTASTLAMEKFPTGPEGDVEVNGGYVPKDAT